MDEEESGLSENELDSYYRDINDHYIVVSETMPLLQNYAFLTLGFSLFEKTLNDVCVHLREERGFALSLKDIHGQGVARAKIYLRKVCQIARCFDTPAWASILQFAEIRNAIAHRSGYVDHRPLDKSSASSRLSAIDGLRMEHELQGQEDRKIMFDNTFVVGTLSIYDTFLRDLWSDIEKLE